jgi:hypothetical protein
MPNGAYPLPKINPISPALRLRVRIHRFGLDDQLAHGANPRSSRELSLRAQQLLSERGSLADGLERALESARRPSPVFSARVPVRREQALGAADEIHWLADGLRQDRVDVHGVAMASHLLHDGASPLYHDSGPSLLYAVRSARLALDPIGESFEDVPVAA